MRIGLIVPGFSADERDWCIPALRHLVARLAADDDVRVLTLRYPHHTGTYPLFGAQVSALGGATRSGLASAGLWRATLATLLRMHRQAPFDLLHAYWATETGALAAIAGRMLGVPVVISIAGGELVGLQDIGYGGQLVRSERLKIRVALGLADIVTAGSVYACRMGAAHRPSPIVHLPLGVDATLFHPGPIRTLDSTLRLVHAASLVAVKDQATLLRALAILQTWRIRFTMDLAGAGGLESSLRMLAHQLHLSEVVRFCGAVEHDALPQLLRGATAFVLSSRHEAQCMAVLEAAACGTPTVGAAVGVVPELAPDAALAVPPGDPAALADALAIVVTDHERQRAMGQAAALRAARDYSVEACVARLREVYRQCS
jgi:glycosyltransferase involved in cell wall biosynthesis